MKSVLFVTWDGPQTNYLESLFFPIFGQIATREAYEFHVIQFTWADPETVARIKTAAQIHRCHYTAVAIDRDTHPLFGKVRAILSGRRFITKYIAQHNIRLLMPRSTMPALMVGLSAYRLRGVKIVFDADGFPNEERIEFAGHKKTGWQYWLRQKTEIRMLRKADVVLVRSSRAIGIHLGIIGERFRSKFFVVANGRDPQFFRPQPERRLQIRKQLGLAPKTTLFIYCGSIGPQYLPDEMLAVFAGYKRTFPDARFLVLTGDASQIESHIPSGLRADVTIQQVPFAQIPDWLDAADIAFALRIPSLCMLGVAPIKLGEYLMMGLPTLASSGIGDTEELLRHAPGTFLYDYADPERITKAVEWCKQQSADRTSIRRFGIAHFSLSQSAEDYIDAFRFVFPEPEGSQY